MESMKYMLLSPNDTSLGDTAVISVPMNLYNQLKQQILIDTNVREFPYS